MKGGKKSTGGGKFGSKVPGKIQTGIVAKNPNSKGGKKK